MDGDNDKLPQSLVECSSRPSPGPQTHEEIKAFNDGFKAGLIPNPMTDIRYYNIKTMQAIHLK